jgi:GAF domain-containing protein
MRSIDGKIFFVVDAEENPDDVSHLGDEYQDSPAGLAESLAMIKEPFVDEMVVTDQWGTYLTGYAPIYKSDGTLDAVLGIDIAASNIIAYQNSLLWITVIIFLVTVIVVTIIGWFLGRQLTSPILTLIEGARRIEAGDLTHMVQVRTRDEIAVLAEAFNSMSAQLHELVSSLERRVDERTQEVEQRSNYLSASAQSPCRYYNSAPDELIRRVVDLIRDTFFTTSACSLLDENKEYAILHAGTGEAGRILRERGHRIRIGEGMVGWCIEHAQARVALEAGQDAVRLASPLLPATRSEAALPLRSRGQVAGALTVQSDKPGAFDEVIISMLQTMVDQVGTALDNARLFTESEQALKNLRRSVGDLNRQAWHESLQERAILGYHGDASGIQPIEEAQIEANSDVDESMIDSLSSSKYR